ncbi:MAG: adenylate/guanylate cyclase domain-containing protein [Desulfobacterales bacterium]|nr:MAG: adenylate/guanylate cyclase domain-containing protein [Desulfobacterales bacterium]
MKDKQRKTWKQHAVHSLLTMAAAMSIGLVIYRAPLDFFHRIELETIDMRFKWRGERPPGPEVVLAVIDEKSIAREGKWIWPRKKIARLVTRLSDAGAKTVGFDIGFLEPDQSDRAAREALDFMEKRLNADGKMTPDLAVELTEMRQGGRQDQGLADAMLNSCSDIILGYFFHTGTMEAGSAPLPFDGSRYAWVRTPPGASSFPTLEAFAPQPNLPLIRKAAKYSGHFNIQPDRDGVVRRIPLVIRYKEQAYAPLSVLAAASFTGTSAGVMVDETGIRDIRIGSRAVPTDRYGYMVINFRGAEKKFPHVSVTDILNGEGDTVPAVVDETETTVSLRDKIILVGATAVGIYDLRVTPYDEIFPGLEIHANIVDNILHRDFLRHPDWIIVLDLAAILSMGLLLGFLLPRLEILPGSGLALLLTGAYIFLAHYMFTARGLILHMTAPLFTALFMYMGITIYKFLMESRQKRFIRDAFAHYLAPSVVRRLIESPEKLVLGGELRHITAFFSDVEQFTSISEKLTPEALVELLNEFLTEMTDVILRYEGTVDKFEGDAIIAFFGAPNIIPDHEHIAVLAAIDMQKRLAGLREKWASEGRPRLKMRIGLNSGEAVVGNMGSKNRMDYTMMGDTVNTASRLEGINKVYGTSILIGENTARKIKEEVLTREIDQIAVIGKLVPIRIHEVLGRRKDASGELLEQVARFENALSLYRDRQWDKAAGILAELLAVRPDDTPVRVLAERCAEFRQSPPPENWNGVYTAMTK